MYSEFNQIIRQRYASLAIAYRGEPMAKHYNEDFSTDEGAHCRLITQINEPTAQEIGFDAAQQLTGYLQLGAFIPVSDGGLNFSLNDLADQVRDHFPRRSFREGNYKVEWLSVEREQPQRTEGHMNVTLKVHFRAFYSAVI